MPKKSRLVTKSDHRKALESMILAQKSLLDQMKALLKGMRPKPPVKERAPNQSAKVTPAVESLVSTMIDKNPTMPNSEVAHRANLNPGRVSEILAKRSRK